MKVKIKRLHDDAKIPSYAKYGDAAQDLTAVRLVIDEYGNKCYGTGLAFEIPEGYVGLLFPRSSNCRTDLILTNSVGILDSGFRGEVLFKFRDLTDYINPSDLPDFNQNPGYRIGDRIGQILIIPYPKIEFVEVEELSQSERGESGYGSSGR